MSPAEATADFPSIPRDSDGPVFPCPWAARAFALTVALNERGLFAWSEWAERLGAHLAAEGDQADPEAYWRAWTAALEDLLATKQVAGEPDLVALRNAWRRAAAATPHGEPIELVRR